MADENRTWRRHDESFWRAHHEAWKRSDLNQRQYCEAEGIPLKAFGNWRTIFKAEPQPPERKLLWRRRGLSHTLSHSLSHTVSHSLKHGAYPSPRSRKARSFHGRAKGIGAGSMEPTNTGFSTKPHNPTPASRKWRAATASTVAFYAVGSRSWRHRYLSRSRSPMRRAWHDNAAASEREGASGQRSR